MKFNGLTGSVNFDKNGVRKDFKLDVIQVSLNFGPSAVIYILTCHKKSILTHFIIFSFIDSYFK